MGYLQFRRVSPCSKEMKSGKRCGVPDRVLRPDQDDGRANRTISDHDPGLFLHLVELLVAGAGQEPVARDALHLATLMAHSARLVRGIVRERLAELQNEDNPVMRFCK